MTSNDTLIYFYINIIECTVLFSVILNLKKVISNKFSKVFTYLVICLKLANQHLKRFTQISSYKCHLYDRSGFIILALAQKKTCLKF